jgi:hypothetical protein
MTREGMMGLEYLKWSARVTPAHNVILAYTRTLAGPMDYTPGGFRNVTRADFEPRHQEPLVMCTRAHQLALFVVFESAFEMAADDRQPAHPHSHRAVARARRREAASKAGHGRRMRHPDSPGLKLRIVLLFISERAHRLNPHRPYSGR